MGDNGTRHSQRASAGLSKAIRRDYVPPDTQIVGPDGTVRFLGRRTGCTDPVIAYHKYNPARRDGRTGKRPKPGTAGGAAAVAAAAGASRRSGGNDVLFGRSARGGAGAGGSGGPLGGLLRGPMSLVNRVPFMHLVLTAALAHRVWCFVTRRFFGLGGGAAAASAAATGERQLARRGAGAYGEDDECEEDDEFELDERAEELLAQMQNASMLPTMLRASLPRQHRASLAKRAAQQYHSRPRDYRTAHQMMHGGPAGSAAPGPGSSGAGGKPADAGSGRRQAQRRPLGKLEKMDLIVRQQIRAAMLAQQRQQLQQQQQQQLGALEAGPSGAALLALPGPAGAPGAAASNGRLQAGPSSGPLVPLPYASAAGALPAAQAPHRLPAGPVPPPRFQALPPELRARMQGARHPGAAALAPAARTAAAGPPPLEPKEDQTEPLGAAAAASGASGSGAFCSGVAMLGAIEASGESQGHVGAASSGGVATGEGSLEEAEARLAVPRVARGVRTHTKAAAEGPGRET